MEGDLTLGTDEWSAFDNKQMNGAKNTKGQNEQNELTNEGTGVHDYQDTLLRQLIKLIIGHPGKETQVRKVHIQQQAL